MYIIHVNMYITHADPFTLMFKVNTSLIMMREWGLRLLHLAWLRVLVRLAGPMTSTTNQILYRYLYQIDIVFLSTAFIFVSNNIGICIGIGIYNFCIR